MAGLSFLLVVSACAATTATVSSTARAAAVRIEIAIDPVSMGPDLAAELAARHPWTPYEKEIARRLRVGSTGTGFFVNADGDLVTSAHVVLSGVRFRGLRFTHAEWDSMRRLLESVRDVWVTVGEGEQARSYLATPVAMAEELDLAVLRVSVPPGEEGRFVPLPIARGESLRVGQAVVALGFPEDEFLATEGRILSLIHGAEVHSDMQLVQSSDPETGATAITVSGTSRGPVGRLQHSAPTGHGNSGGPLLDRRGRVIGVAYALLSDTNGTARTDLNLGIAANVLRKFLREHAIAFTEVKQ